MLLIWRGWGLVAVVALFLPMASCAGFITDWPGLAFLVGGLTLLGGGVACIYLGRKWNRDGVGHSFYGVPLQVWGWVYAVCGGLSVVLAVIGAIRKGSFRS